MRLPDDRDSKEALAKKAVDAVQKYQDAILLQTNRYDATEPDYAAFCSARRNYDKADATRRAAYAAQRGADADARSWLMIGKNLLIVSLGKKPNAAWKEAGWSDETLEVPSAQDKLFVMLGKVQTYLTNHTDQQLNDPRLNFTAARAGALQDAITFAMENADTTKGPLGVGPAETATATALNYRDLTEAALDRRLHGLYAELEQKLAASDPRWTEFGFNAPGTLASPDPVATLTATAIGNGRVHLVWSAALRTDHYQIWLKKPGDTDFALLDSVTSATEYYLENQTTGALLTFQVRAANPSGYGPFSPAAAATVA